MLKTRLFYILLILSILLPACVSSPDPGQATVTYDSKGRVITQVSPQMSSKDYLELQAVKEAEKSNQAYYAAEKTKYASMGSNPVAIALNSAIDALSNKKAPSNYNDTLIKRSQSSVDKWKIGTGVLKDVATLGVAGYVGSKALNSIGGGTTVNAEGGATVTGAIGTGNTADTAPYGGIPLGESSASAIEFGESGSTLSLAELCAARGGEFVASESRCSDGSGGEIAL